MSRLVFLVSALVISACGVERQKVKNEASSGRQCATDHPSVGRTGSFSTLGHGVSGTATVVSNCEIRIDNFNYDGGGLDVRVYGAQNRDFEQGFNLSEDLSGKVHSNESFRVFLPNEKSLDDLNSLSIWCVDFAEDFGNLLFR